jgi:hypothetical protein
VKLAALAAIALVLAACGPGAPEQEAAERAVGRETDADVECTARSRLWFSDGPPAEVFICAAQVDDGLCDRYRAERDGARFTVALLEREASCVLPPG